MALKVAWVSHRDPNFNGGAEAADNEMLAQRPEGVDVCYVRPGGVEREFMEQFDHIIVTGFWGFMPRELNILDKFKPVLWMHDLEMSGHWLYEGASKLILLSEQHKQWELKANTMIHQDRIFLNPGTLDTTGIIDDLDHQEGTALWAHRPAPHKGLDLAADWAQAEGKELIVLVNRPRAQVLQAMADIEYFVLMSHIYDPGPRSVMEAQLSGCKLAINENVGWWDLDRDELRELLGGAAKSFWQLALED